MTEVSADIGMVKAIAGARYGYASRWYDDLVGYGLLGLCKAAQRFDPGRGALFLTYAKPVVLGAIRDGLRELDWLSWRERRAANLGELKIEFVSLGEMEIPAPETSQPDYSELRRAARGLPRQERQVVGLYLCGLQQKQIAEHMGVSEVRVSLVMKAAREHLRKSLRGAS